MQAEDEADRTEQRREPHSGLDAAHFSSFAGATGRFLNICNIRSVTAYPPTTFAAPKAAARNIRT